ncbi:MULTISPECIES: helix-turn-helix domain-containing protein [unclassified Planococcus (in: firmicutes)]|uniref:helix-turn-helix domain-containing protein n=1 Tax=unclassified Planococcus (in: firmicutes) TaxID=2662419 RepID=UPI000C32D65D|nr:MULTISPECIES: helix-turn-helix domain-containing protein [unclassified Planococcus (in: firmicutes)]AUD12388.1 hypothetical protein CW734_00480 [Planococcus sp. MB-3u-03]PKG46526.1 hypothetical protein CXF66_06525 [Planococcus sp. Urea-trap-24]PKG89788.1 hypothetical protein CXF91_06280 [Planococcus sp. Urea-3u-39]PKH40809.1 hypothetical protein CXF77_07115 [Planococcus sp. MB-3u-09]
MIEGYTPQEAADLLGFTVPTIYAYEKKRILRRIEDPHRLKGTTLFVKEDIDILAEEKKKLDNMGITISELARKAGVFSSNIREAIRTMNLQVPMIPSNPHSSRMRFAITPEYEEKILSYLNQQKTRRAKKNHLYVPSFDIALHQRFLIAGEQKLRLKTDRKERVGFELENGSFIPYIQAIRAFDIEPLYRIHRKKNEAQSGFTDIVVPTGKKAFYEILDFLYSNCGVENFNADIDTDHFVASIRNAEYRTTQTNQETLELVQQYITNGKLEMRDGCWVFCRTEKSVQVHMTPEDYLLFKQVAKHDNISLKNWIENALAEKANELRST